MTMTINGSGTITGLSAGGLPSATINQTNLNTNVAGNGPAFSAYLNTNQTGLTSGVFTKVLFDVENFDTNSNFASSRFTPTVAGYYQINASLNIGGTLTGSLVSIFKNGSRYTDGTFFGTVSTNVLTVSAVVYCNGSTDYIEIHGYLTGTSLLFAGSSVGTVVSGAMIRSA